MELDAVPQPALEQVDRLQGADLVVAILRSGNGRSSAAAAIVREALGAFPQPPRAVLVVDDSAGGAPIEGETSLPVLVCHLSDGAPALSPQEVFGAYQTVLGIGRKIGARACAVIASDLEAVTPLWVDRLVRPALEMKFDLVAPCYARHRWEGLLNRSIFSPLYGALYGKRIQNPLGPDFGLSGSFVESMLESQQGAGRTAPMNPMASVVSGAVRGNFQICEAYVGTRLQPPADWMNLSSLLAQILGPVFLDVERNVAVWQRVRGLQAVPAFGMSELVSAEGGQVDAGRLIDSFHLGAQNLQDVWSLVLPPKALFEVRKLSRLPAAQFRMADDLWVSIVYDFALAHRVRQINRDHLLRSFTPLYLGWVASYALEVGAANPYEVEARLERLARAYEAGKPYLVSRWRWPDRFNP